MKGHFEADFILDMSKQQFQIKNCKYDFEGSEKETSMAYDFTEKSLRVMQEFGLNLGKKDSQRYPSRKIENGDGLIVVDDEKKVEKVLQVVDDIHSTKEKLDKMIDDANKSLREQFDDIAYKKMVYKLKSNEILYYRISRFFSERRFINEIQKCVDKAKITGKMKKVIRVFMSMFMNCPEFIFVNLGKIYEDSTDINNDKLWGYLKMIYQYFFKNVDNSISCLDMAQRIYGLVLDALGEASSVYEN